MRRYGFLEEEKTKPKSLLEDLGEIEGERLGDIVAGYKTGMSTSDSNKTVTMAVSYSTNVA
jgi:hypothetical protein